MRRRPIEERFAEKYEIDPVTECWNWTASTVTGGYGMLGGGPGKPNILAHRFSYEHYVGPIPDGMVVCHGCDNPRCVNPKHMRLDTQGANMKDMERKGRARVLTADSVHHAILWARAGMSHARIAARFGVDRMTVTRAIRNAEKGDYGPFKSSSAPPGRYTKVSEGHRRAILGLLANGESVSAVAEMFDVDRKTVRNIRDRGLPPGSSESPPGEEAAER